MHSLILQTWNCRLSGGWAMNLKLQTAHRNIYPSKSCLCETRTHDLHVTAWHSTDETMLNSFYLVFIVLIIYLQQASIFMKQHVAPTIVFVVKKKVVRVKLELTTLILSARMEYLSQEKKKSLWCSYSRPQKLHDALTHRQTLTVHKWTS